MCEHIHTDFKQTFASWSVKKRKFDFNSFQTKSLYQIVMKQEYKMLIELLIRPRAHVF